MLGTFNYMRQLKAEDYNIIFRDFFINKMDLSKDRLYVTIPQTGKEKAYKISELMEIAYWVIERYLAGEIIHSEDEPFSYIAYRNGLIKKEATKANKQYENVVSMNEPIWGKEDNKELTLEDSLSDESIEEDLVYKADLLFNVKKLKERNRNYVMIEHMVNLETVLKMSVIGVSEAQIKLKELLDFDDMADIKELIGDILSYSGINLLEIL